MRHAQTISESPAISVALRKPGLGRSSKPQRRVAAIHTQLGRVERWRDKGLHEHEARVGNLAATICSQMGLPTLFSEQMQHAAMLHDIGKIAIPDRLLKKNGSLDAGEWQLMRQHCDISHAILGNSDDPIVGLAAEIGYTHHECFDGSGYPRGLEADAIPLSGRIAAICDVYDALREDRTYRKGMSHKETVRIITKGDGRVTPSKFDPAVLAAFVAVADELVTNEFWERCDREKPHRERGACDRGQTGRHGYHQDLHCAGLRRRGDRGDRYWHRNHA